MRPDRAGVTLLELLVALVLLGLILLGVRAMTESLIDTADRLAARARTAEQSSLGDRVLRDVLSRVEQRSGGEENFFGDESELRFRSWCESAHGWIERCAVSLRLELQGDSAVLTGRFNGAAGMTLASGRSMQIRYHGRPEDRTPGQPQWGSGIDVPDAISLVRGTDTLLLPLRVR